MTTYLLGIDVSTTATKALLIDERGQVAAVAATEYSFETPQPQWTEQNAALWWDGAALLAGVGAGVYADVNDACARTIGLASQVRPGADARVYADYYPLYRALYPALAPQFKRVSQVAARHL